jgi:hypothetical protein
VGIKKVTLTYKEFIMAEFTKINRDRSRSQSFEALGVPVGSILVFKKDPVVTVKTVDDKNKVEYQGKFYSISTLAKQLVGSPVSGYLYFKFEGRALKSLVKSDVKPAVAESAESLVSEPAEAADVLMDSGESEAANESERGVAPLPGEVKADAAESTGNESETEA